MLAYIFASIYLHNMKRIKLQMQLSLDGFASTGPADEQKWVTWAWDEIQPEVVALLDSADTHILGRGLAMDYIPYWEETAKDAGHEMLPLAKWIVAARKIIFSKTVTRVPWDRTEIEAGDLVMELRKLKQQPGKDILACGGTSFVSNLIKHDLIDDYFFYINPVAIGRGVPVFDQVQGFKNLRLVRSKVFPSGLVLLQYENA